MILGILVIISVILGEDVILYLILKVMPWNLPEDSSSLVAELQEKLQEEKAKFLEQLERAGEEEEWGDAEC